MEKICIMEKIMGKICQCDKLKKYFVDYERACPLHGEIKSMEDVIKNYSTIDGRVYHAEILSIALKNAGYIHKSEAVNYAEEEIKDLQTKLEDIKENDFWGWNDED